MLLTNHILLYTRLTYVKPYQNILEHFSRKYSSDNWSNGPIRLQYMPLIGQTFHPYSRICWIYFYKISAMYSDLKQKETLQASLSIQNLKSLIFFFTDMGKEEYVNLFRDFIKYHSYVTFKE